MTLDSLAFVYCFLPLGVGAYYLMPNLAKKPVLAVLSLLFYYLAAPGLFVPFVGGIVFDYALLQLLVAAKDSGKRACIALSYAKHLALLLYYGLAVNQGLWPFGFLIYGLGAGWYFWQVYTQKAPGEKNFVDYLLFTAFFGNLYVGPLVRHEELMPQLKNLTPSLTGLSQGVVLFIVGLAKKVLVADQITAVFYHLQQLPLAQQSQLSVWAMVVALALGVFFHLSAFGDMARGLGRMFSLEYPRLLYYPYQAKSMAEAVERLNIPLYTLQEDCWPGARTYNRQQKFAERSSRYLLMGACVGLWFGPRINMLLWGLFLGLLMIAEKYVYGRLLSYLPSLFRRGVTFVLMVFSFVLFAGESPAQSLAIFLPMVGVLEQTAGSSQTLYVLSSNWGLVMVGILLCSSLFDLLAIFIRRRLPLLADWGALLLPCGLLWVTTAFML